MTGRAGRASQSCTELYSSPQQFHFTDEVYGSLLYICASTLEPTPNSLNTEWRTTITKRLSSERKRVNVFIFSVIVNKDLLFRRQNFDTMDVTLNDSTANTDIETAQNDPGAYIVPFAVDGQRGKWLDSLPDSYRAWAVNELRSKNSWVHSLTFLIGGIANFFLSMKHLKKRIRDTMNGCSRQGNQENIPYLLVNMRVSNWMLYLIVFTTGQSIQGVPLLGGYV